jgi:hypothetical protein
MRPIREVAALSPQRTIVSTTRPMSWRTEFSRSGVFGLP